MAELTDKELKERLDDAKDNPEGYGTLEHRLLATLAAERERAEGYKQRLRKAINPEATLYAPNDWEGIVTNIEGSKQMAREYRKRLEKLIVDLNVKIANLRERSG